ncbi:hypothetical protein M514_23334 [Trichuris suis]|uniref:Retrotransposon gag domain-containing protein n=1 Tax=Trichuris suis TaxID=68888 RepID=A0A085N4U1_9BILA|nr:hypothetical protein M514_23334 [Trichuris suis]
MTVSNVAALPVEAYRLFDPQTEAWEAWSLQFRAYLDMNLVVDDCIKRSCLVTSLAPKAFEELRRVCLPKSPFDFTFSDIESQMSKLFGSRVVLLKERSKLFGLQQEAHQTPMQFANYLRHMAANCDFDQFNTDAALVVQFVNGIRNQAVRVKLLAKGKDLTLDDAVTYLQISEDIQREDANTVNEAMDSKTCHAVNTYPSKNHVIQPKVKMRPLWQK